MLCSLTPCIASNSLSKKVRALKQKCSEENLDEYDPFVDPALLIVVGDTPSVAAAAVLLGPALPFVLIIVVRLGAGRDAHFGLLPAGVQLAAARSGRVLYDRMSPGTSCRALRGA